MQKSLKNEIFRWISVAILGYVDIRLILGFVSRFVTNIGYTISSSVFTDSIMNNWIAIANVLIGVVGFTLIILYLIINYGRNNSKTLLMAGSFCVAAKIIFNMCYDFIMSYSSVKPLSFYENAKSHYYLNVIVSFVSVLLLAAIMITVAIGAITNFRKEKALKITCLVLLILFVLIKISGLVYILKVYYPLFSITIDSIISYYAINLLLYLAEVSILFYIFFCDKNYKRIKE